MTEEELYNLTEEELYRLLQQIEVKTAKEIEKCYDDFAFTLLYVPAIAAYLSKIKAETLRPLNSIEKKAIQQHLIDKALNEIRTISANSFGVSYKIGEILSYNSLKKSVPEGMLRNRFKWSLKSDIYEYINRKNHGLKLSERIWNLQAGVAEQIEATLQLGILEGRSANDIAFQLKKYLKDPDKLFRRVRDEQGKLKLSKRAREYHPGQGVNRSSFKNARRLATNEINKTYRYAQWEKWQQLDFVVGYEIRRSNRVYDCDVCESLKGKYPKDFVWSGWHVLCRCHAVSILTSEEELMNNINNDTPIQSKNRITDYPQDFKRYIKENKHRYKPNKTDWIDENKAVKDMFK